MKKLLPLLLLLYTTLSLATSPPQKLTVLLDWFPNPDHAPLIVAQQQGFFKQQGLDVELISPNNPDDPVNLVANKKVDIGITYQPKFMEQIDQGLPLIRIGTLIDKPLNCLVVLNNSGIKTISDLKGKLVGSLSNSGLGNIMLKAMLERQGLSNKDVEVVNVSYNLTQALLSKKVDAVTGMMRNFEVAQLEQNGHKVSAFFPEEYGIPNYSELIFITHINNIHDKRFPRFLEAIKQAVAYLDEHPKETWKQFAKTYPEADNKVNQEAWLTTLPYFAEDPANFDRNEWDQFAQFMQKNQLIKKTQPISKYAVIVEG